MHKIAKRFIIPFSLCISILLILFSTAPAANFLFSIGNKSYYEAGNAGILIAFRQGNNLTIPDYHWWYGCAPTATGMMLGFYDINGYAGLRYDNLIPGAQADLDTFGKPGAFVDYFIASPEHIRDFWTGYGNFGDDPHPHGTHTPNCLADFMGSNQDQCGNVDGSTTFFFLVSGEKVTSQLLINENVAYRSGLYGIGEYTWAAGYGSDLYNQLVRGYNGNANGFTFEQLKNEIDAGRPVLIHLDGHTMIAFGYSGSSTVYVHDTWSKGIHIMTWGEGYINPQGIRLPLVGVTCFIPYGGTPSSSSPVPPSTTTPSPPSTGESVPYGGR